MKTKEKKTYSIYSIRNKVNGKRYIGLSYQPLKRIEYHRKSKHLIGKAIRKYGWKYFDKRILQKDLTLRQAKITEQFYIKKYNCISSNGYNQNAGGQGANPSAEVRAKISKGNKGKIVSAETRVKISKAATGRKYPGRKGTRPDIIIRNKERTIPKEKRICACGYCNNETFICKENSKQKYIFGHQGKVIANRLKVIAKNSKRLKENNPSKQPEVRAKISETLKKKYKDPKYLKHRIKIDRARRGKHRWELSEPRSKEYRKKQSESQRKLWEDPIGRKNYLKNKNPAGTKQPKMIGRQFGRLLVLSWKRKISMTNKRDYYLCLCACSKKKIVKGINLRKGVTQSCGCLNRDAQLARYENLQNN